MTDPVRIERYMPLTDLAVRSVGGGNIIDAYAAAFSPVESEIRDHEGHYIEQIDRSAFDRTIQQRGISAVGVIFNHGKTIHGTPSERFSMPYGKPIAIVADQHGLMTSTEVSRTELGEEILQLVNDGVIKGQSFSGATYKTETRKNIARGGLPTKVRMELGLREYGLTPFPSYDDAHVVAVRADLEGIDTPDLVAYLATLAPEVRDEIVRSLTDIPAATRTDDETDPAAPRTVVRRNADAARVTSALHRLSTLTLTERVRAS